MKSAILLLAFSLLLSGCLLPWEKPVPLNETGLLPPIYNYTPPEPPPMDFGEIGAAGAGALPIMCTVEGVLEGQDITLYMQGSNVRSEYFSPETNGTYVTVIKGESYYVKGGMNFTPFENCSWIMFDKGSFKSSGYDAKSPYGARAPNYTAIPGLPKCRPGTFGSEIFETDGTVCDFGTVMARIASMAFNCSAITDPMDRALCEQHYNYSNVT